MIGRRRRHKREDDAVPPPWWCTQDIEGTGLQWVHKPAMDASTEKEEEFPSSWWYYKAKLSFLLLLLILYLFCCPTFPVDLILCYLSFTLQTQPNHVLENLSQICLFRFLRLLFDIHTTEKKSSLSPRNNFGSTQYYLIRMDIILCEWTERWWWRSLAEWTRHSLNNNIIPDLGEDWRDNNALN